MITTEDLDVTATTIEDTMTATTHVVLVTMTTIVMNVPVMTIVMRPVAAMAVERIIIMTLAAKLLKLSTNSDGFLEAVYFFSLVAEFSFFSFIRFH